MRGYPIGTFLFWFLPEEKANSYVFYKFKQNYHERSPYNERQDNFSHPEIIGVLDGQQRLSSLYIALFGTYATRLKYRRRNDPSAYPKRKLYLNLLNHPYSLDDEGDLSRIEIKQDKEFDFRFLDPNEVRNKVSFDKNGERKYSYWLELGTIYQYSSDPDIDFWFDQFIEKETNKEIVDKLVKEKRFVKRALRDLHRKIHEDRIINYFKTEEEDLESILNIFVRVNSGAVVLSKSDLLFSTIVASWEKGRDEIEELQKKINDIGDGFKFTNDFIMRCLLVLTDLPVVYKVNSFNTENVNEIKKNWDRLSTAIIETVKFLDEKGFNGDLISSQNAVIPITYYIYKGGKLSESSKSGLIRYLKYAFMKGVFGGQGDTVLNSIRNAMTVKKEDEKIRDLVNNEFNFNQFLDRLDLPGNKSLKITEEDIEEFLEVKKGAYSLIVLSMIYPNLRYGQVKLHQDHIHPYSQFKDSEFTELGLSEEQQEERKDKRNMLPNLQLIEGSENQSKNDTPFKEWLENTFGTNPDDKRNYLKDNFIPENQSLDFQKFESFFEERRELLRRELKKVLMVS